MVVAVGDPTDSSDQPRGKQTLRPEGIWYTAVTGIWQTVWLEPTPAQRIEALTITPDIDAGMVRVTIAAAGGTRVRLAASLNGNHVADAVGAAGQPIDLKIAEPRLWSPDDPTLYDLNVELLPGDDPNADAVDAVDSYFGMRKIEIRKDDQGVNRLFLNNHALFQYGPLDQGWWPDGLYTPPSDAALKHDVEMTKKFGMNMARKHVKVELDRWYYWCDKLGLLVWQDMPSTTAKPGEIDAAAFRRELQSIVDRLYNHPSIVMWVPFNEGWGQHRTRETTAFLEGYDPSRVVNEASGWHNRGAGAVADMHSYPGPSMRSIENNRVSVLGEFGGLGMPIADHTWQDKSNWGYVSYDNAEALSDAYVNLLTSLRPLIGQGLAAAVYTQTSDVETEVNGLMTYDRKVVKMDPTRIAAAARRLHGPPPKVTTIVSSSAERPQTWRFQLKQPPENWPATDFDDASWPTGWGGFGARDTPGARLGTRWQENDIWLRRSFTMSALPAGALCLNIFHDDEAEVFLNGRLAAKVAGFNGEYQPVVCCQNAAEFLHEGENHIAVHCHQTKGGQFIDLGIAIIGEPQEGP